jgi:hypothetical protein
MDTFSSPTCPLNDGDRVRFNTGRSTSATDTIASVGADGNVMLASGCEKSTSLLWHVRHTKHQIAEAKKYAASCGPGTQVSRQINGHEKLTAFLRDSSVVEAVEGSLQTLVWVCGGVSNNANGCFGNASARRCIRKE